MTQTVHASEALGLTFQDPTGVLLLPESSAGPGTEQLVTGEGVLVTLERIAVAGPAAAGQKDGADDGELQLGGDELLRGWAVATTQHYRDERSGRDLLAGFVGAGERRAFGVVIAYDAPPSGVDARRRRLAACAAVDLGDGAPVGVQLNWGAVPGAEPRGELLDRAIAGLAPLL